jgi:hypothetical protein
MRNLIPLSRRAASIAGIGLVVLCAGSLPARAGADSYQVQASVPYPAPTQAAVFDSGLDGTTVANALVTLTGSCQIQNPADVVVIMRGSTSLGSAICTGTFSIPVMLVPGPNVLVGRTVNTSLLYGPDSTPITITLHLPPTVTPTPNTPTPTAPPSTPQEVTATTNSGAAAGLVAATTEPFSVLTATNDVTVRVKVDGGSTPYTLTLNWGDGSLESHSIDQAGEYGFTHTYEKSGNYTVRGSVRDVLGASSEFVYAAVSGMPAKGGNASGTDRDTPTASVIDALRPYLKPAAVTGGVALLAGGGYVLGIHNSAAQLLGQTQNLQKHSSRMRGKQQVRRGPKRPVKKR